MTHVLVLSEIAHPVWSFVHKPTAPTGKRARRKNEGMPRKFLIAEVIIC